mgnify:CR=1 FL=1
MPKACPYAMIRYILPHTSIYAYALIYKHFTHFSWCFCGVLVGVFAVEYWMGIVEKFVEFRFFFIIRLIAKYFTFFLPSIGGFFTFFLPNICGFFTLFLPNVWGCGGVSFDEEMGEMVFFGALWW